MEYMVIFAIIVIILNLPSVKGFIGEIFIRFILGSLDKNKYIVVNDVLIPTANGRTSQIDHVIVSLYGIFVIETKNYRGWIFGSEHSKTWTQIIYKTKNQFLNPIIQNKGHVKALQDLLTDYSSIRYIPIVVFTLNANFKKLDVTSHVVYSIRLLNTIKTYVEENISAENLVKVYQVIQNANTEDTVARKEHVKRIREFQGKIDVGICPRCEGRLVERKGKHGVFFGCSNYPKCRYSKKK